MAAHCLFLGLIMQTIELTLYEFHELSDTAKNKALETYRNNIDFAWMDESRDSIATFCDFFSVKLLDYRVGAYEPFHFRTDSSNENFRGLKLKQFNPDYMPTGYCLDCDLWMTFYDEFKRTGDAKEAFNDALYSGFKAWRDDMEHQLSDEYISDFFDSNDFKFMSNGAFWGSL